MHRRRPPAALRRLLNNCEPLEPRRLLAASISGTTLNVAGTAAADTITVTLDGTDLVVTTNSTAQRFAKSTVTQIDASLGNGDDSLEIDVAVDTPASLNGEAGDDTLVGGGGGADTLDGGSGNDRLDGGGDEADGTLFSDVQDTVTYASRTASITVSLTAGDDAFHDPDSGEITHAGLYASGTGGQAGETDTYSGIETILGGSGDDQFTLIGQTDPFYSNGNNTNPTTVRVVGNAGDDSFTISSQYVSQTGAPTFIADGGAGDDGFGFGANVNIDPLIMLGGDGNDTFGGGDDASFTSIDGGAGIDELDQPGVVPDVSGVIPPNVENFTSGIGGIRVVGNDLDNVITLYNGGNVDAGGGNDTIILKPSPGGSGSSINGGDGDDTIVGNDQPNTLLGGAGDDSITGGTGNDLIDGGEGNNRLDGGDGNDTLSAGIGNDAIYGGAGDDSIHGDAGNDTLYGQDGRDKIFGGAGNDRIDGGNANDVLRGEDGDDKVYGRDGNDSVSGGEGRDSLYGGDGNDSLNGDGGRDIVYGGAGTDAAPKQSIDRIYKEIERLA